MASGLRQAEVTKRACKQFGVSDDQARIYIQKSRDLLIKWSLKPREFHFNEVAAFCRSLIEDPAAKDRDKIAAARELSRLYGLYAPKRVEIEGEAFAHLFAQWETANRGVRESELEALRAKVAEYERREAQRAVQDALAARSKRVADLN